MNDLMPLGELRPAGSENSLVVTDKKKGDLAPHMMGVKGLMTRPAGGTVLRVRRREITIADKKYEADPHDLITMIRTVTQQIGDYKQQDNLLAKYMMDALRKARSAMVSDLQKFGIHWEVDKATGESVFWM